MHISIRINVILFTHISNICQFKKEGCYRVFSGISIENWPGKQIYQENKVTLKVLKGKVENDDPMSTYKVDGLSGATLTSRGVSNMIEYWFGDSGYSNMLKELDYES